MSRGQGKQGTIERLNAGATHPAVHQADALAAGPFVYVSGLMADDGVNGLAAEAQPKPGYPYYESAVKLQMRHILTKVRGILGQAGLEMDHVVKAHAFLTDPADFLPMDEVWREFFRTKVSRTFVRAGALPVAGARLCVDVMACRPDSGLEIARDNAGPPPPFSQKVEATRVGDLIFTSGQLGYDSRFGFPPESRR
ncbi:MAG: RidA family protein, partial [Acetobacterales bacterium]